MGFVIIAFIVLVFKPVPIVKESECIIEKGMVIKLFETGKNDISIILKDNDRRFYINRGFEVLNRNDMMKLIGRDVVLKYPSYWTPLDPFDKYKHVSKLEYEGVIVFDETLK